MGKTTFTQEAGLIDIFYKDTTRLDSFIAQLQKGALRQVKLKSNDTQGSSNSQATTVGIPGAAAGNFSRITTETAGRDIEETKDPKVAAERIQAQKNRRSGATDRINELGKLTRKTFLTEAQVADLLDRLTMPENQPGALILLVKKLKARVVVGPKAIRVRLVLAVDGAGERT